MQISGTGLCNRPAGAIIRPPMTPQTLEEFRPRHLLPNLFAGMVAGMMMLISAISNAALIFSGGLADYLPAGISNALLSATLITLVVVAGSSFRFAIAGPDANACAILALMATSIAGSLQARNGAADILFPTIWAAIALSAVCTGLFLFALGQLRLGRWIRFIPYPVVGGFLAGTGWLLTQGSFTVMAGMPLNFANLSSLLQPDALLRWLPGLGFAMVLLVMKRRSEHYLVMPGLLLSAIVLSHLGLWLSGIPLSAAIERGWFLAPSSSRQSLPSLAILSQVDWAVLGQQIPNLAALMVVTAISILLSATGIEIAAQQDCDLDRELRAAGMANIVSGGSGGMVGFLSISRSLLNYQAGADSRLAGVFAALVCGGVLLFGASLLHFLPKPVLGGLLLYIGLSLLIEWVYDAWFKLPHLDYALVAMIILIIALSGFIAGMGAGIVVACLLFVVNYSRIHVIKHELSGSTQHSNVQRSFQEQKLLQLKGAQLNILCLQAYIFFGTANTLLEYVRRNQLSSHIRFLILDFRLVSSLDSSAGFSFLKLKQLAHRATVTLVFTNLSPRIEQLLRQSGCLAEEGGASRIFPDLDHSIEWCEDQILQAEIKPCNAGPACAQQLAELFLCAEQVPDFISYLEPVQAPAGYMLFRQGEAPEALFFVESGQLTVSLELPDGQTKRLRTIGAGTVVGEIGLYTGAVRSASIVTDAPSKLFRLSAEALQKMQEETPQLAAAFGKFVICTLAERLSHREKELQLLLHS